MPTVEQHRPLGRVSPARSPSPLGTGPLATATVNVPTRRPPLCHDSGRVYHSLTSIRPNALELNYSDHSFLPALMLYLPPRFCRFAVPTIEQHRPLGRVSPARSPSPLGMGPLATATVNVPSQDRLSVTKSGVTRKLSQYAQTAPLSELYEVCCCRVRACFFVCAYIHAACACFFGCENIQSSVCVLFGGCAYIHATWACVSMCVRSRGLRRGQAALLSDLYEACCLLCALSMWVGARVLICVRAMIWDCEYAKQ